MKKIVSIFFLQLIVLAGLYSQVVPKGMNYQAVARNQKGEILADQNLSLRIYLFSGDNGQRINHYSEVHQVKTNALGLFDMIIGEGTKEQGEYGLVPWNQENIWMEVAIKDRSLSDFATVSSSKLLAVPYALHANTADRLVVQKPTTSSFAPPEPGVVSTEWSVFGNAKTDASGNLYRINSLGTTDFVDLIMITDNVERLRILAGGDIVTKLNFEVGKNLTVNENLYVLLSATICDSLIAKKNVQLNTAGGSTVNHGAFTVADMSPTLLSGILTVDKATLLNTSLTVQGPTDLNSRLFVNKKSPTKLTGTLQVDSIADFNNPVNVNNMSPTTLTGTLRVDKYANFQDSVRITSTYQTDTAGLFPTGSLQTLGGAYIGRDFYVKGVAKFGGPVAFGGAVSIFDQTQSVDPMTGALKVSGGVGIGKNLNVGGMTMLYGMTKIKDLTQSTDTATGALKVQGGVGIGLNLNVGGASRLLSTLIVEGATTINNTLAVTKNIGGGYVASFRNTNTTVGASGPQGICIQLDLPIPAEANHFITFKNSSGTQVGTIQGQTLDELHNCWFYKSDLKGKIYDVTSGAIDLIFATIDLGQNIARQIGAAASVNVCVGLGVVACPPIISLIASDAVALGLSIAQEIVVIADVVFASYNLADFLTTRDNFQGVTYTAGGADYAEYLKKADINEMFELGDIVGVKGGVVSKVTDGADKIMVVSNKPIILGNTPDPINEKAYEKIAFLGQVPVTVFGKVNLGDYIIPNGRNNGVGYAVSPKDIKGEEIRNIVGIAWSTAEDALKMNLVTVAVGLNVNDNQKLVDDLKLEIATLKNEMNSSYSQLAKLVPGFVPPASAVSASLTSPSTTTISNPGSGGDIVDIPYAEVKREDILKGFEMAKNIMIEKKINIEDHPFWKKFNTEPEYKEMLIVSLQKKYNAALKQAKMDQQAKIQKNQNTGSKD
ncbi:MAG: hypothetical protein IPO69_06595 [Saprospiraceae bacterium]|nr:hypothetical protein [Saprospiraceae bacterium]